MGKQKSDVNKSEEIRQILKANPRAKAKEVVTALDEKGIKVTTAQVYFIMGNVKGRKKRKARKAAGTAVAPPSLNSDPLKTILKVKSWASEVGGLKKLRSFVEALSE